MKKDSNYKFNEFYTKYRHLVFLSCLNYLRNIEKSEDMTADIFREFWEKPQKLEKVQHLEAWLPVFTRNKCFRFLQNQKRDKSKFDDYFVYRQTNSISNDLEFNFTLIHEQHQEQNKMLQGLEKALSSLRHNHRTCISLHYLKNKSYQEIMTITKFTFKQVDNFLYYGKKKLVQKLQEDGWEHGDFKQLFNND
ncbi:MAG: RNA polymerase sigma factor [Chitinophagales bacterium]